LSATRAPREICERVGAGSGATYADLLRRPGVGYADIVEEDACDATLGERVAVELKYQGYIRRQTQAVERLAKAERVKIPSDFDYAACRGISREAREKLTAQKPETLGQAGRIPGVTPADAAVLSIFIHFVKSTRRKKTVEA
jgi:tRNA uridine 5-carboxymethylaminomethyl modification enzyme